MVQNAITGREESVITEHSVGVLPGGDARKRQAVYDYVFSRDGGIVGTLLMGLSFPSTRLSRMPTSTSSSPRPLMARRRSAWASHQQPTSTPRMPSVALLGALQARPTPTPDLSRAPKAATSN